MARKWVGELWPASFKGVPFKTERSAERGGRRIVDHEFPMRDIPYLEDLGEAVRKFDVTAYLASDSADAGATALSFVCSARGPGLLVLPFQGPVLVRCYEWERSHEKDRLGYIAFTLKCTREGAASSIISAAMGANLIFIAAEAMSLAAAASFAANIVTSLVPDFVREAASGGIQGAAAVMEAVRTSNYVEPTASAAQRAEIETLYAAAPVLIDNPETAGLPAGDVVEIARAIGDGMTPDVAMTAFSEILNEPSYAGGNLPATSYPTPNRAKAAQNGYEALRVLRLGAITAYCEAVARFPFTDRPQGIAARSSVAEFFARETDDLPPERYEYARELGNLRDATIAYLSYIILDLSPVIIGETNRSMPSLVLAHAIYQDVSRSTELVERNQVAHPSFMPTRFEALANEP